MPRPCACGAVANLDAVIGDTNHPDWWHHAERCWSNYVYDDPATAPNVCGQQWSTPNPAVWPPVIMHRCDLPEGHDGDRHHCTCITCEAR